MLVSPAELVAVAKATITECSVQDVENCMNDRPILIDIREPDEYRKGHIPGAVHLPRGMLEFEIHGLVNACRTHPDMTDAEQPIILYCGTGGRSALAAQSLESLGYTNVRSMAGGLVAWAAARLPLDTPSE
jgi:rhodanese-related sulfurtransferase